MKSINSLIKWILFVPVCLMSVTIAALNGSMPGTIPDFFGTDQNGIAEIIAFTVLGLFIVCFVLSLFDRKTSPVHMLRKNPFCGVVAVTSALAMAACAAYELTLMINAGTVELMPVITIMFTAVSGIAMLYLGLNHFSGKNSPKSISILYLSLPLWCGAHLIDRFLGHTASPVAAADTMDLIMFVAMAMFFINIAMVHAVIPGKNAVKAGVNFGFPTVIVSFVYGLSLAFGVINAEHFDFLAMLPALVYLLVGLYALGFTVELSFFSKTNAEQIILEAEAEEDISSEYYDDDESESEEETSGFIPEGALEDSTAEDDNTQDADNASKEDVILFDDSFEADNVVEEVVSVAPAVVRVAEDSAEDEGEDSSASELFMEAQRKDKKSADDSSQNNQTGSDGNVIIDGNVEPIAAFSKSSGSSGDKPKGPTSREAIMYEDDDFILSVDGAEAKEPVFDEDEDISAFILEKQDRPREETRTKKSYEERLDEIDKLIISLQGDDAQSEEE
ncbi:MAG: hypothetical protein IJA62_00860 [Ruminococcus sp.]|nr:hypothetical protein [Ruminococcus sp.]